MHIISQYYIHTCTHTDFAAMAGLDYTSIINMPIILSVGMQTIQIAVELINDPIFENNEMFQGTLTIISGERVSLSPGTANATIIEDEGMYMYYTLCCIFSSSMTVDLYLRGCACAQTWVCRFVCK